MPPGTKKKSKKSLLKKVTSIGDLRSRCNIAPDSEKYVKLAIISAKNLGLLFSEPTLNQAIEWLITNASETDEDGVVDEINFCRDLV